MRKKPVHLAIDIFFEYEKIFCVKMKCGIFDYGNLDYTCVESEVTCKRCLKALESEGE